MPMRDVRSERGAILIQTAVASLVLMGFAALVMDYGVYWVSRAQAQNAADSAALAGALARAYDGPSTPPDVSGPVVAAAIQVAQANLIWTAAGIPQVSFDCPPELGAAQCVR